RKSDPNGSSPRPKNEGIAMVTSFNWVWIGSSGRHNRLQRLESVVVTVKVDFRSELGNQKLSFDRRGTWTLTTRAPPVPSGEGFPCRGEAVRRSAGAETIRNSAAEFIMGTKSSIAENHK